MPSLKPKVKWGIECPDCKHRLFSWSRHDFRWCEGQHVYVDGGDDYLRFSGTKDGRIPKRIKFNPKKDKRPNEQVYEKSRTLHP